MKNDIKFVYKVNMIKMIIPNTIACIVEGNNDFKIFYNYFNNKNCDIIPCDGKNNLLKVISSFNNHKKILGIVDSDFDDLLYKKKNEENIFYTDTHDSETLIIKSNAFDKLINELCNQKKLNIFLKRNKYISLKKFILQQANKIGKIKFINQKYRLGLSFQKIDYTKFLSKNDCLVNHKNLITEILSKNSKTHFNKNKLNEYLEDTDLNKIDPWLICNGHDFCKIFVFGLENIWGYSNTLYNHRLVESLLRSSYEYRFFQKSNLYNEIHCWQDKIAKKNILQ